MQQSIFSEWRGKSQADRVLWHLQTYGRITNLQCHELYGIRHCPSVIRDLRKKFIKQGNEYAIINETKKGCNRFGDAVTWDDYVLVKTTSKGASV
jgi:hypothetical protein